ncbi:hypothetical protein ATO2_17550 [Roseovarius sp. 22II1-1F6A]|nr:hypothetical protein ATO2_17550 [Roseovarius sp. 22II1-1F6A]
MNQGDVTRIEGPNLALRLIQPDDAAYVHGLRINPAYNEHLSEVRGTAEDQRAWIQAYKAREAAGEEFYYIIERHDGTRCGTVRLYNIEGDRFTWGSWILDENKPRKAALESALLSFRIGFEWLGLRCASIDVRAANTHAVAFYRRFGMKEEERKHKDIYFSLGSEAFYSFAGQFQAILLEAQ